MPNYNKVILAGNLTRDVQLSYTPAQQPVADFSIAVNRNWTGKDGQKQEETCFVELRAFGKQAEVINQYCHKGNPILIEGRLHFSAWEDKNGGGKRSKLRVTVEKFEFLSSKGEKQEQSPQQQSQTLPTFDEDPNSVPF